MKTKTFIVALCSAFIASGILSQSALSSNHPLLRDANWNWNDFSHGDSEMEQSTISVDAEESDTDSSYNDTMVEEDMKDTMAEEDTMIEKEENLTQEQMIDRIEQTTGARNPDQVAKVGECYVPAYVRPSCEVVRKRVLARKGYEEKEVVPPVLGKLRGKLLLSLPEQ